MPTDDEQWVQSAEYVYMEGAMSQADMDRYDRAVMAADDDGLEPLSPQWCEAVRKAHDSNA